MKYMQRGIFGLNLVFYSRHFTHPHSYDPPLGLERTAELRTGQGSGQRVLAYRNQIFCVILLNDSVGKGAQDEGDRFITLWDQRLAILHEPSGEGESNLLTSHWQVVRNRVLDDFQQLHRSVSSTNAELVQQLNCGEGNGLITSASNQAGQLNLNPLPIIPANLLNVRGILVCGLISMSTFFAVRM